MRGDFHSFENFERVTWGQPWRFSCAQRHSRQMLEMPVSVYSYCGKPNNKHSKPSPKSPCFGFIIHSTIPRSVLNFLVPASRTAFDGCSSVPRPRF